MIKDNLYEQYSGLFTNGRDSKVQVVEASVSLHKPATVKYRFVGEENTYTLPKYDFHEIFTKIN